MRSIKSGLFGLAIAGLLGSIAVVGCSADGESGDLVDPTATGTGSAEPGQGLPPSNPVTPTEDSGKGDSGKKPDSGKPEAGKDSGPPPPAEGDPCTTANQIFKRSCLKCGTQEALCLADTMKVSTYGQCTGEVVNGCIAGTTEQTACGNCGTATKTCNQYCAWTQSACTGQPASSCTPGAVELVSAGCPADQYRQRSCQAACTWDNFSATCSPPPTYVLVPPTVGGTNSTITVLRSTQVMTRNPSYGTCPLTGTFSTYNTPYAWIEVKNPSTKAVTVSIYNSQATGGPIIDTVMAAYPGAAIPSGEPARKTCVGQMGDYGTTALTGDSEFASLDGTKAVPIPANSSVQVYFASYGAYDPLTPADTTGMIKLNVKTETVAP